MSMCLVQVGCLSCSRLLHLAEKSAFPWPQGASVVVFAEYTWTPGDMVSGLAPSKPICHVPMTFTLFNTLADRHSHTRHA